MQFVTLSQIMKNCGISKVYEIEATKYISVREAQFIIDFYNLEKSQIKDTYVEIDKRKYRIRKQDDKIIYTIKNKLSESILDGFTLKVSEEIESEISSEILESVFRTYGKLSVVEKTRYKGKFDNYNISIDFEKDEFPKLEVEKLSEQQEYTEEEFKLVFEKLGV